MNHRSDDVKLKSELNEYIESGGTSAESTEFKIEEAKLRRKLDLFIAPVMMMLMLISYLDRGNIGFAATQGMSADIGLKGNQLNVSQQARKVRSGRSHSFRLPCQYSTYSIFWRNFQRRSWSNACNSIESYPQSALVGDWCACVGAPR